MNISIDNIGYINNVSLLRGLKKYMALFETVFKTNFSVILFCKNKKQLENYLADYFKKTFKKYNLENKK